MILLPHPAAELFPMPHLKRGVYFPRAGMKQIDVLGEDSLRDLRAKWPVPRSAKEDA